MGEAAGAQARASAPSTCEWGQPYTANGEIATKTDSTGTTSYTYDPLGNLLHVSLPNGTAIDYVVDGENRRVGKKVNGTLTQAWLYQDALKVVAQLDGSGNVTARYVFGSKPNVPAYVTTSAGTFRILSDHLGSPRIIVNSATGAVAERIDYDEFGNVTQDTQSGFTPFGFAGGLYDKDTGFVRFGARDYDAHVGRWTAKDPLRFKAKQFGVYEYVGNDPIDNIDLSGRNHNGCGPAGRWYTPFIPNNPTDADFSLSCDEHDECYGRCGADKNDCDARFLDNMLTACREEEDPSPLCVLIALMYYGAVHNGGDGAFAGGQSGCVCQ